MKEVSVTYEQAERLGHDQGYTMEGVAPCILGLSAGVNAFRILIVWYGHTAKWVDVKEHTVTPVVDEPHLLELFEEYRGLV